MTPKSFRLLTIVAPTVMLMACAHDAPPPPPVRPAATTNNTVTPEQMDEIQQTMQSGQSALSRCYTEELENRKTRSFKGRLVVSLQIGTSGTVTNAQVIESQLQSPVVERCVEQVIASWEFPKLKAPFKLSYPIEFAPAY